MPLDPANLQLSSIISPYENIEGLYRVDKKRFRYRPIPPPLLTSAWGYTPPMQRMHHALPRCRALAGAVGVCSGERER